MARLLRPNSRDDFEIAIICALPSERDAVEALLDYDYETDGFSYGKAIGDSNAYTTGRLGNQHVVLAYMPGMGMISAAAVASSIRSSFERVKVALVVGICGGVPITADGVEILLGDVIISTLVIQIDFGRQYPNGFIRKDSIQETLIRANPEIRAIVGRASGYLSRRKLRQNTSVFATQICAMDDFHKSAYPGPENDKLYPSSYRHKHQIRGSCSICDKCQSQNDEVCEQALHKSCAELGCDANLSKQRTRIRTAMGLAADGGQLTYAEAREAQKPSILFGQLACSNQVMKSGQHRDKIATDEEVIGFEMESAGTWDYIPTIVIKSVCDYADSHKNKSWQRYAAATAAACTKAFLEDWRPMERPNPVGRPDNSLSPSSFVPFPRDLDFIPRRTIIDQIHDRCSVRGSRTALFGLGGVGKSQLAIEYSYQFRLQSPDTWIFWVHASNADRFEQSYRDIADKVKIPERGSSNVNIFKLVHDWLEDNTQRRWFMILDNVDDASFLLGARKMSQKRQSTSYDGRNSLPLIAYLRESRNGSILITTRSKKAALELVEDRDIITVDPMQETQAVELLEKKLGQQSDKKDVTDLAAALEFMPLAIVQAAAYISQMASRFSMQRYIEKFEKNDKGKAKLLNHEGGHLRRDRDANNSIIVTWQISFDHIRQIRPSAANLLSLMSFFDRQGIPKSLLQNRNKTEENKQDPERRDTDDDDSEDTSESSLDDEFAEDVSTLINYSFISLGAGDSTFEMHRLVQVATREWLKRNGELERWKQQYIKNLCTEFPKGEPENWKICQALFPHAKSALEQPPETNDSLREWASILYHAAWYAWRRGNVADAEILSTKSMRARKKLFGQDNEETLLSMEMVGLSYKIRGGWKESEELFLQMTMVSQRVLGAEHPVTLSSMFNLASTFSNLGKWREAEELERQVIETSKRVLGEEHADTLAGLHNLATTFFGQERYDEAEDLGSQVYEIRKRILGEEHPDTLISMSNLALTLKRQGRDVEALSLMKRCADIRVCVLGVNHFDTVSSLADVKDWEKI